MSVNAPDKQPVKATMPEYGGSLAVVEYVSLAIVLASTGLAVFGVNVENTLAKYSGLTLAAGFGGLAMFASSYRKNARIISKDLGRPISGPEAKNRDLQAKKLQ